MHCEVVKDNEGRPMAMICGGRRAPRRVCHFCNSNWVNKLCDFPVSPTRTCDKGMCEKCATVMGDNCDYCPRHKNDRPSATQESLFGAAG